MTVPAAFSLDSARRVAEATRAYEASLLGVTGPQSRPIGAPGLMLVRTPGTLPDGYTGAEAIEGELVELPQGATAYHTIISKVWIQDLNDEALSPDTVYHARFAGTKSQDSTTLPFFLAQSGASSVRQSLDIVVPWRILPITYLDSEWFPGGGTFDTWVYVQDLRYFEGSAGVFNPRVDLVREPNDSVFDGSPGKLFISAYPHIMPLYTVDGSNTSANWKAASFAMSWYMRNNGWRPALIGKWTQTDLAYYTYSGVNYPVYWNYELLNDPTFFYAENLQILTRSFEAELKYELCTAAGWNDPSGYLEWDFRIAGPTQKKVKVFFSDRFELLNTSNTGIQRCLVTPSWNRTVKTQTSSASWPTIPVSDAQTAWLIAQVRHDTSPAPSTTPVD